MALLKSGSTVGGNLIWHQGILPVFPSNNSVYYKDYKIYTTQDKPTPNEIGAFTKTELNKSFSAFLNTFASASWYKIGTANLAQGGKTLKIDVAGGNGYNGMVANSGSATMILRTGNGSTAVNTLGRIGIAVHNFSPNGEAIIQDAAAIETSAHVYDIYALFAVHMSSAVINVIAESVEALNDSWTQKYERQTVAPKGVQQIDCSTVYTTSWKPSKSDVGLGNVTNDAQVKKAGDTMTGKLDISFAVNNTQELLNITSASATPIRLYKPGTTNYNISIQFKNDAITRYLGLGPNQELRWGTNLDQGSNAKVYTTEFKPTSAEVQAWYQNPESLGTENLNDIREPGIYKQVATAQALTTRNYPEQTAGVLLVYRNSANNWGLHQEYRPFNSHKVYTRYTTTVTAWSGWARSYSTADKPTYDELGVVTNYLHNSWTTATNGNMRRVVAAPGGPESIDFFGITAPTNDDKWGFQIAGRTNRVFIRCNENGTFMKWERLYHTGYKPNNSDVGLSNVTNDAQVKKSGDTMTGNLTVPVLYVTANDIRVRGAGNRHLRFESNDGTERGIIWAEDGNKLNFRTNGTTISLLPDGRFTTPKGFVATGQHNWGHGWNDVSDNRAPFVHDMGNTGSSGAWFPAVISIAQHTGGYRTGFEFGQVRSGTEWGQGVIRIRGDNANGQQARWHFLMDGTLNAPGQINAASFSTDGNVVAGLVQTTGDVELKRNGRRHIRWKDVGDEVDCYIYKDPGNTPLRINIGRFGGEWTFSSDGTFYSSGNGNFNNVYIRSDVRLKTNFAIIDNALDKVGKLKGLTYDKRENLTSTEYNSHEAGIIAQELQNVLPEAVNEHEGILNVSSAGVNALLINAINELRAEVQAQREMIEKLSK